MEKAIERSLTAALNDTDLDGFELVYERERANAIRLDGVFASHSVEDETILKRLQHYTNWTVQQKTSCQFEFFIFKPALNDVAVSRTIIFSPLDDGSVKLVIENIKPISESHFSGALDKRILDALNDVVLITESEPVTNPGPRVIYVNKAFERGTVYSRADIIGNSPRLLQNDHTNKQSLRNIRKALDNWESITEVVLNTKKNGELFYAELSISPVQDETGWYIKWIAIQRDVTKQRDKAHFEQFVKKAPVGIAINRLEDGGFVYVNDEYSRITGYTYDELNRLDYWQLTPKKYDKDEQKQLQLLADTGGYGPYQKDYIHKQGHTYPVLLSGIKVTYEDSREHIWSVVQDLTENQRLIASNNAQKRELQEANVRLKAAVQAGHVGIWDWDIERDALVWDSLMFDIYGIPQTSDANTVSLWEEALHPEDKERAIQALQGAVNGIKEYDIEFRIQRPCGEVRCIKGAARVLRNQAGEALRVVGTNLDVTESRRAQDKINRLEKRNRALLDYSPVCHKIVDLDFKLRYMNRNGYNMLGLPINDDWYGQPYPFAFFPADAKRLMEEKLAYVKYTKEQVTFESIAHDGKGNEVWLLHNLIPVFKDDLEELDYLTVVSADITEQKNTQDQLRHQEKMNAIGQLAGGVAHDFNNQLAGISGYAELLQMEVSSDRAKGYLAKIIASVERSSDLTRKMLDYSRKQKHCKDSVNVHKELDDTIELLKHSVDKRIAIQQHFGATGYTIKGDSSNLQNAFLNIAINAADAMEEGGLLTVTTEIVAPADDKRLSQQSSANAREYVKVVFEDNGCGIAKEHLEKVFEPFFTTKAVGKGTGMGLASVYGIVKQHEGFSSIESEPGTGTRVYMYLPVSEEGASKSVTGDKTILTQDAAGKTVLVVDDEKVLREICRDLLAACGYQVLLAENGQDGVDIYREHSQTIDVVIMDLAMPVMSGHDACKALKTINPDVKIIIASGYDSNSSEEKLKSSEISAFIQKPYRLKALRETIVNVTG